MNMDHIREAAEYGWAPNCQIEVCYIDADGNSFTEFYYLQLSVEAVPYLSAKMLYDYGNGVQEDPGYAYEKRLTSQKWDEYRLIFYWNYQDADGNWQQMPVHPDVFDSNAIQLTRITENIAEDATNAEYYYHLSLKKAQWDSNYTIAYTDAKQMPFMVEVYRSTVGF